MNEIQTSHISKSWKRYRSGCVELSSAKWAMTAKQVKAMTPPTVKHFAALCFRLAQLRVNKSTGGTVTTSIGAAHTPTDGTERSETSLSFRTFPSLT